MAIVASPRFNIGEKRKKRKFQRIFTEKEVEHLTKRGNIEDSLDDEFKTKSVRWKMVGSYLNWGFKAYG